MTQSFRAGLAAAAASICFGVSVVITRFIVTQTQPVSLAFMRYVIATICMAPVLLKAFRANFPRRDLLQIAVFGAIFFGVFPWSFSAALTYSPTSRVAIELATMPLITLIISRIRGYDRITLPILSGQLLAFAGLFVALRSSSGVPNASNVWIGDVLTFVTALCGAIYNVFSRPLLKRYPPLHITALSMLAGALFLAPIAAFHGMFSAVPAFTPLGWLAVAFLGVLGGALGFGLWIWALQRSTPSRVAVFIALNPITAISVSVLLLHEPVTAKFYLGFTAVITGIFVANWRPVAAPELAALPVARR